MSATSAVSAGAGTIPDILRARVSESPDAIAYCYEAPGGWAQIDWKGFSARAHVLGAALRRLGLESGDNVGILSPTCLGWELFQHAILLAGGVVVGLEPHDTAERLGHIADHARLRMLVVHDSGLLEKLGAVRTSQYRCVIVLDGAAAPSQTGNRVSWSRLESEQSPAPLSVSVTPDAPATLIYTSGTTGQPKGILYRHEQAVLAVSAITRAYPSLPVGARLVCWLPLSNLFQRIMNLAAMRIGGTVYLVGNPLDVLKALPQARPDMFIGVPRFYEKLHEGIQAQIERKPPWLGALIRGAIRLGARQAARRRAGEATRFTQNAMHRLADRLVLGKLRQVMGGRCRFLVTGSAPTPLRLLEFFDAIGLPLFEAYGLSENIVPMALNRPGQYRLGTVGKPLADNDLKLDADGELLVKGAGVFDGYHNDTRSDLFTADGYYRTGDYAAFDQEGYLQLKGRKSEIIKTSTGRRISPVGIEGVLQSVPWVDRAVVVGAGRKCLAAILFLGPQASESIGPLVSRDSDRGTTAPEVNSPFHAVIEAARALAAHEQPAGYLVSRQQLSIEAGDLTPNLKMRRSVIEGRYAAELDALYDEIERQPGRVAFLQAKDEKSA